MSKVIIYNLDAPGLATNYAAVDRFLETESPDNWYEMSDEEQDEYAREQFYQQFSWGWQVVDV